MKRAVTSAILLAVIATTVYAAKPVATEVEFNSLVNGINRVVTTNTGKRVIDTDEARILVKDYVTKASAEDFITKVGQSVNIEDNSIPLTNLGGKDITLEAKIKTDINKKGKPTGPSTTIYGTERFLDGRADIDYNINEVGDVCADGVTNITVFPVYSDNGIASYIVERDTGIMTTNEPLNVTIACDINNVFGSQRGIDNYLGSIATLDVLVTAPDIYTMDIGADGVIEDVDLNGDNYMDAVRNVFPGDQTADQAIINPEGDYNWTLGGQVQDWMSMDPNTGIISVTPQESNTPGTYTVNIQAQGPTGSSDVFYVDYKLN